MGSTLPLSVISPVMASQRTHRPVGQQRDQRGHHGHARRRPVLGNGARRHVDVDVVLGEELFVDAKLLRRCERTQLSAACIDSCITS